MMTHTNQPGGSNQPSNMNQPGSMNPMSGSNPTSENRISPPSTSTQVVTGVASIEASRPTPEMPAIRTDLPSEQKCDEVLRVSEIIFHSVTNWVDFYRMVFGVGGLIQRLYPTNEEQQAFGQHPAYTQLQEQLNGLRERDTGKVEEVEPQRMITIRVPKSIHERLCAEAEELEVSVNKLCISKLIQMADRQIVPKEKGKRRGRRPGPQKRVMRPTPTVGAAEAGQ